jgi:hypothetical protein
MAIILTPYGPALELPEPPPLELRLLALVGDLELLERELSRALAEIDALRRRVSALERRERGADEQ